MGFAGHQLSCRFNERFRLKGVRRREIEWDTPCCLPASIVIVMLLHACGHIHVHIPHSYAHNT